MWSRARPGVATTTCDTAIECLELALDRLAAEHGDDLDAEFAAVAEHRLADLDREFAGGDEHEDLWFAVARLHLQRRQRERRRLAGARRRLAEQVASRQQERDRLALDRRRLLVAEIVERGQELVAQTERCRSRRRW